jgi:hypothetical protein
LPIFDYGEKQMHKTSRIRFAFFCSDNRKSKACPEPRRSIQNLKWGGVVAIGITFAMCGAVAQAQQPVKMPRIGFLAAVSLTSIAGRTEAFRQGCASLGTWRGKTLSSSLEALWKNLIG